ncbi:hypothetical protein SAMN05660742_12269 [Propionispira arboris]|uniref:Cyanobacterial TRADD-N associated 2 transmembrane domain-containing protein n=1 Tax=Propionispira arboris TaxID=84035 RepID=A0A1H7CK10_9FIRM|nr:hypothetical protein [Propionispira arboris]SEJ89796.1 hypothetical protein SAMN05660742_12269 [Propionispira arboris]
MWFKKDICNTNIEPEIEENFNSSINESVLLHEIERIEFSIERQATKKNLMILFIIAYGMVFYFMNDYILDNRIPTILIASIVVITGTWVWVFSKGNEKLAKRQVAILKKQLTGIKNNEGTNDDEIDYFTPLVNLNIKNLGDYYELVKESNAKSFWVALIMSGIGITIIFLAIMAGFSGNPEYKDVAYISTVAGVFIELITGLLFYLYNKTIIQLKKYHSSLLDMQNVLLSFKLIGDVKDEKVKIELMKEMLSFLVKHK